MESNKLIAEFMGHKLGLDGDGMGEPQCRIFENGLGTKRIEDTYNKSWDWLMPVVEKIESLRDVNGNAYRFTIDMCNAQIEGTNIEIVGGSCKLDTTYQAVIEFIKWYNK